MVLLVGVLIVALALFGSDDPGTGSVDETTISLAAEVTTTTTTPPASSTTSGTTATTTTLPEPSFDVVEGQMPEGGVLVAQLANQEPSLAYFDLWTRDRVVHDLPSGQAGPILFDLSHTWYAFVDSAWRLHIRPVDVDSEQPEIIARDVRTFVWSTDEPETIAWVSFEGGGPVLYSGVVGETNEAGRPGDMDVVGVDSSGFHMWSGHLGTPGEAFVIRLDREADVTETIPADWVEVGAGGTALVGRIQQASRDGPHEWDWFLSDADLEDLSPIPGTSSAVEIAVTPNDPVAVAFLSTNGALYSAVDVYFSELEESRRYELGAVRGWDVSWSESQEYLVVTGQNRVNTPVVLLIEVDTGDITRLEFDQRVLNAHLLLRSFDANGFLASKLDGELDERVGAVVLVRSEATVGLEALFGDLEELEGYTHVSAEQVRIAAERYASDRPGMRELKGEWAAYGLIPMFPDTPTEEWESALSAISGTHFVTTRFETPRIRIPDGWEIVGDVPFDVWSGAVIARVAGGVVVLQWDTASLIALDGSSTTEIESPVTVGPNCCGNVQAFTAAGELVVLSGSSTWILDGAASTWREADPRPDSGWVFGSAAIEGRLYVVTTSRSLAPSQLVGLDMDTGTWQDLEPVPSPISVGGVTSDGSSLLVAGTLQDGNNWVIGERNPVLHRYKPGEGWTDLPSIPIDGQAATIVWTQAGLLGWNYDLESALLDETGEWRVLGTVPMPPRECYPHSQTIAGGAVALCQVPGAVFDAHTETWHRVPPVYDARYVVTDTAIYALAQPERDRTQLLRYSLAR